MDCRSVCCLFRLTVPQYATLPDFLQLRVEGRPSSGNPTPTEPSVRISRTGLFENGFAEWRVAAKRSREHTVSRPPQRKPLKDTLKRFPGDEALLTTPTQHPAKKARYDAVDLIQTPPIPRHPKVGVVPLQELVNPPSLVLYPVMTNFSHARLQALNRPKHSRLLGFPALS